MKQTVKFTFLIVLFTIYSASGVLADSRATGQAGADTVFRYGDSSDGGYSKAAVHGSYDLTGSAEVDGRTSVEANAFGETSNTQIDANTHTEAASGFIDMQAEVRANEGRGELQIETNGELFNNSNNSQGEIVSSAFHHTLVDGTVRAGEGALNSGTRTEGFASTTRYVDENSNLGVARAHTETRSNQPYDVIVNGGVVTASSKQDGGARSNASANANMEEVNTGANRSVDILGKSLSNAFESDIGATAKAEGSSSINIEPID